MASQEEQLEASQELVDVSGDPQEDYLQLRQLLQELEAKLNAIEENAIEINRKYRTSEPTTMS